MEGPKIEIGGGGTVVYLLLEKSKGGVVLTTPDSVILFGCPIFVQLSVRQRAVKLQNKKPLAGLSC